MIYSVKYRSKKIEPSVQIKFVVLENKNVKPQNVNTRNTATKQTIRHEKGLWPVVIKHPKIKQDQTHQLGTVGTKKKKKKTFFLNCFTIHKSSIVSLLYQQYAVMPNARILRKRNVRRTFKTVFL